MRKLKVVAILMVLFFGLSMFAGPMGPGMRKGLNNSDQKTMFNPMDRMKEVLNLTDEQAKKLETLTMNHRKATKRIRIKIQKIRLNIKEEMLNAKINYDKILQYEKQINALRNKLAELRINNLKKVEKILTKEQFEKFKEFFLNRKHRKGFMGFQPHKGNMGRRFR